MPDLISAELARRLDCDVWSDVRRWLEQEHPDILTRISRLTEVDEEYRLDNLASIVPPDELRKVPDHNGALSIYRGLPQGFSIRPGDWVSLEPSYARDHGTRAATAPYVDTLAQVDAADIYWAGTDMREFFYLPAAWRNPDVGVHQYLQDSSPAQLRALCDGERSSLIEHHVTIEAVRAHVLSIHDHEACGAVHGPAHWERVANHAISIARSEGLDPLVPYLFGLVHDSQRLDDGNDPQHGPRAAAFVASARTGLFAALSDEQVEHLAQACDLHSNGMTEAHPLVQSCWDADRLDLARVHVYPDADYLCTDYAKRPDIIARAVALSQAEMGMDQSLMEYER